MLKLIASTQYIFTSLAISFVIYLQPKSSGVTCLLISIICASYFIGRGITQLNTGAPLKGWKSPEVQFLILNFCQSLWFSSKQADAWLVSCSILIGIVAYNFGRGLAKYYRPNNPLILR